MPSPINCIAEVIPVLPTFVSENNESLVLSNEFPNRKCFFIVESKVVIKLAHSFFKVSVALAF